jgi:hypothetical protein
VINTAVQDEALARAFTEDMGEGYDVILDFLWGHPTEILLRVLTPVELKVSETNPARPGRRISRTNSDSPSREPADLRG